MGLNHVAHVAHAHIHRQMPPPHMTTKKTLNCALAPAYKGRWACGEMSAHGHKHILQPTPAWTHSCAAGLELSACDVLPQPFHWRSPSPDDTLGLGVTMNHCLPHWVAIIGEGLQSQRGR